MFSNINELLGLNVKRLNEPCDISNVDSLTILTPDAFCEWIFGFSVDLLGEACSVAIISDFVDSERAIPAGARKHVSHVVADPVNGGYCVGKRWAVVVWFDVVVVVVLGC